MAYKRIYFICITAFLLTALSACKDKWEEHTELQNATLKENLLQPIINHPNLGMFEEYLKITGYDELLKSSQLLTVWAPTDEALQPLNLDMADTVKLRQLVANHISYQQYYTYSPNPTIRIKAINGKYLLWDRSTATPTIEGASVMEADKQYGNGVLHVINQPMEPKPNTWELLNTIAVGERQRQFINSQNYEFFNPNLAEQIGVNENTGEPIYREGTGVIRRNRYLEQVRDIMHEDTLGTFIILTDNAFEQEYNKIEMFFATSTEDSTRELTSWSVVKDLAFAGVYTKEQLPDTLVSKFGVKVPIDKTAIVSSFRTSNGIVHVMNKVDVAVKDRIQTRIIEGESAAISDIGAINNSSVPRTSIDYRYRDYASGQHDLRVYQHSKSDGVSVRYRVRNLPAATYDIYMRAVKDFGTADLTQKLAIGDRKQTETFPYVTIPLKPSGEEVKPGEYEAYIGRYTVDKYGTLTMFVVSNLASGDDMNPIVLDYIKMVPVL